ncbi:putative cytidylate kinase [Peptoniphilus sp. ING2-D1G]|nr:putative cytidylate kinase [Peptoniphilus sp. ING2-D1G]
MKNSFFEKLFNKNIENNTIFTIDSEHGSGAFETSKIIGEKLGIEVYDESIIELKTLESKINPDNITKEDSFLSGTVYDLYRENYSYSQEDILENDAIFLAHSKTIRYLASKGPCIFIGKCSNYVLKEKEKTFDIFITADYETRIERIIKREEVDRDRAISLVEKMDTRRSNHYKRYAGGIWGRASEYDMTINSSKFKYEEVADIIIRSSQIAK